MSEHTDAARLEATRDAIRTGTAPRPRVEGGRVAEIARVVGTMLVGTLDGIEPLAPTYGEVAAIAADWQRLTAEVEEALRLLRESQESHRALSENLHREWREHLNAFAASGFPAKTTEEIVGTLDYLASVMPAGCQEVIAETARRLSALTAEVERLTKEKARASQMAFEEGAVWGFTRPTGAAIQAEAVRRYPPPTPAPEATE